MVNARSSKFQFCADGEICRNPLIFENLQTIKSLPLKEGMEYTLFDEDHTLSDFARYFMRNRVDAEELHRILGEMLSD